MMMEVMTAAAGPIDRWYLPLAGQQFTTLKVQLFPPQRRQASKCLGYLPKVQDQVTEPNSNAKPARAF